MLCCILFSILLANGTLHSNEPIVKGPSCFSIYGLKFTSDNRYLLITGKKYGKIWDIKNKSFVSVFPYISYYFQKEKYFGFFDMLEKHNLIVQGTLGGHCGFHSYRICLVHFMPYESKNNQLDITIDSLKGNNVFQGVYFIKDAYENYYLVREGIGEILIYDGERVYKNRDYKPLYHIKLRNKIPYKVVYNPNDNKIFVWSDLKNDKYIYVYDTSSGKARLLSRIRKPKDRVEQEDILENIELTRNGEVVIIQYRYSKNIYAYKIQGNLIWKKKIELFFYDKEKNALWGRYNGENSLIYLSNTGHISKIKQFKTNVYTIIKNYYVQYEKPRKKGYLRIGIYSIDNMKKIKELYFRGFLSSIALNKEYIALGSLDGTIAIVKNMKSTYYINPKFGNVESGNYRGCRCPPCPAWYGKYRPEFYNTE